MEGGLLAEVVLLSMIFVSFFRQHNQIDLVGDDDGGRGGGWEQKYGSESENKNMMNDECDVCVLGNIFLCFAVLDGHGVGGILMEKY